MKLVSRIPPFRLQGSAVAPSPFRLDEDQEKWKRGFRLKGSRNKEQGLGQLKSVSRAVVGNGQPRGQYNARGIIWSGPVKPLG